MDNKKCTCTKSTLHILLKIFLAMVVAFFVFIIGLAYGVRLDYLRSMNGAGSQLGMMRYKSGYDTSGNRRMMNVNNSEEKTEIGPGMMLKFIGKNNEASESGVKLTRLFGVVSKIEGNKISIKDNSAAEVAVLSQATTVITSTGIEIGLSSLKAGQNIVSYGTLNKDGQLEAKSIDVQ